MRQGVEGKKEWFLGVKRGARGRRRGGGQWARRAVGARTAGGGVCAVLCRTDVGCRALTCSPARRRRLLTCRWQVLDVAITGLGGLGALLGGGGGMAASAPSVSLIIGDPWAGGARATLFLPYVPRWVPGACGGGVWVWAYGMAWLMGLRGLRG